MGSYEGGQPEAWASTLAFRQKGELRARKAWKAWVDSMDLGGWGMRRSLSTSSDTSRATIFMMSCWRWQVRGGTGKRAGRGEAAKGHASATPTLPLQPRAVRPTHQAVGRGPCSAVPLPAALHGQLPAFLDAEAPVAAGPPASLWWHAHLWGQDSSWPVMPRAPCVQECRAPNPGCSSEAQDGGQGLLRLCTASPHREALPAPARHLACRAAPHVESTAEAVASTSDRKWHQSLLGARGGGQAIVVSLK